MEKKRRWGEYLNKLYKVGAAQAFYSGKGTFYMPLTKFPGALFDNGGYVVFQTLEDYENTDGVKTGKRLNVHRGISKLPNYILFTREPLIGEEVEDDNLYKEGYLKTIYINSFERNSAARNTCIRHYGETCVVCGFNFFDVYGIMGKGYIHVHHIIPLSEIRREYIVDPIKDLIPVCPNCHSMIHSKIPAFTIAELKTIMANK